MASRSPLLPPLCVIFLLLALLASQSHAAGTPDGSEEWGYVQVRPKAHMFWWLYRSPHRRLDKNKNNTAAWPTVLWLQGGPGASGVGYGNFMEVGPLDAQLKPRATTWLAKADLLFVDNPVGTGFSFVEDRNRSLMVRTDAEAARDLTFLLSTLYRRDILRNSPPLHIVAESYGGKFAVTTALAALEEGSNINLAGVALGDSWISPVDSVMSWGPLLYQVSRIDEEGLRRSNEVANRIEDQLRDMRFREAEESWAQLEQLIIENSNSVDFYNFLKDQAPGSSSTTTTTPAGAVERERERERSLLASSSSSFSFRTKRGYSGYLTSNSKAAAADLAGLMNTVIRDKLGIIPKNLTWGEQSDDVFEALAGEFMKPRIDEVDRLLELGVNVTIYSGQLDLICSTKGTMDWVQKLKWDGLENFTSSPRTPIYCSREGSNSNSGTQAFVKSYKNLKFYWILGAGHMVPIDNPCPALKMIADITQSPAK